MNVQLQKINFQNIKPSKQQFDSIPGELVGEMHNLVWTNDLLDSFHRFNNLKVLYIRTSNLTDEFMFELENLADSLKEIHIHISDQYLLTPVGEEIFSSFHNVEIFHIFVEYQQNIDNVLVALGHCVGLKKLYISGCEYTEIGIQSLMNLPNLNTLEVSFSPSITDPVMTDLIISSVNLKNLIARGCINLTNDFLLLTNYVKNDRHDTEPLRIVCLVKDKMNMVNLSPLIILVKNNFIMD